MMDTATLFAIAGMSAASFACRYGGYAVFRRIHPTPALRTALGYLPGALFVSYVVPALAAGSAMHWVGAAATVGLMVRTGNLSAAILGGTAVAWAWWATV